MNTKPFSQTGLLNHLSLQINQNLGDSCINQLLVIIHEIHKSFNERFEVRGVFLDISNAFHYV